MVLFYIKIKGDLILLIIVEDFWYRNIGRCIFYLTIYFALEKKIRLQKH